MIFIVKSWGFQNGKTDLFLESRKLAKAVILVLIERKVE